MATNELLTFFKSDELVVAAVIVVVGVVVTLLLSMQIKASRQIFSQFESSNDDRESMSPAKI